MEPTQDLPTQNQAGFEASRCGWGAVDPAGWFPGRCSRPTFHLTKRHEATDLHRKGMLALDEQDSPAYASKVTDTERFSRLQSTRVVLCATALLCVHLTTGCNEGSSCDGHDPTPHGSIDQYPLALGGQIDDVSVAVPIMCEHESAYIRIERANGARRIGTARRPNGGFDEGCLELPDPSSPATVCPVIAPRALFGVVVKTLRERGTLVNGTGLGPCGDSRGPYESWNLSVGVVDWSVAHQAVQLMADLLRQYDLAGYIGIAVTGIGCSDADSNPALDPIPKKPIE